MYYTLPHLLTKQGYISNFGCTLLPPLFKILSLSSLSNWIITVLLSLSLSQSVKRLWTNSTPKWSFSFSSPLSSSHSLPPHSCIRRFTTFSYQTVSRRDFYRKRLILILFTTMVVSRFTSMRRVLPNSRLEWCLTSLNPSWKRILATGASPE